MTIARKLAVSFGVIVFLNLLVGVLIWTASGRIQAANEASAMAEAISEAVEAISQGFQTEQGTIRGFVMSGDTDFLATARQAEASIAAAADEARSLPGVDAQIRQGIEAAVAAISGWRRDIRDPQVDLMKHQLTVDEARLFEATGENEARIGQVREALHEVFVHVEELNATASATVSSAVAWMRGVIMGGTLVVIVAASILGLWLHRSVGRPIQALTAQMATLAEGDTSFEIAGTERTDEIGAMAATVQVFRQNTIERHRLEQEAAVDQQRQEERRRRIEALIGSFRDEVRDLLAAVGENMHQMQGTAEVLTGIAQSTAGRASNVASASDEASSNVQTVATAAEELSASISEISRQVNETNRIVGQATDGARVTNERVSDLAGAAQRIGDVVDLIQDIAEQTNLLALNATIEAARAGERGKGFAVVAAEVKTLAGQTAKATDEIAQQIAAIQHSTKEAVEAIQAIARTMEEVNGYTSAIAAAVEEQGAATNEISRNVREAATGTRSVVENVSGLEMAAGETSQSAGQVEQASREATSQANRLNEAVDRFLTQVAAA